MPSPSHSGRGLLSVSVGNERSDWRWRLELEAARKEERSIRVEHFPYDYDLGARFSSRRRVFAFEGGSVYAAEVESTFYVIVDEGTQADFLLPSDPTDAEVLARLISVLAFDTADERDALLATMRADHARTRERTRRDG